MCVCYHKTKVTAKYHIFNNLEERAKFNQTNLIGKAIPVSTLQNRIVRPNPGSHKTSPFHISDSIHPK